MPTYKATATATASVTAQFFFRKEEVVTASGSATAESNISQEDAYNTALSIATEVAQSAAQNDANVLIQSVNTSTLGDNSLFLSSSLLKDYLDRDGNNYTLRENLDLGPFKLIVAKDETLNIPGKKLRTHLDNFGTINVSKKGILTMGGISKKSPFSESSGLKGISNTSTNNASSNYGTLSATENSVFYAAGQGITNTGTSTLNQSTMYIGSDINENGENFGVSTTYTNSGYINCTLSDLYIGNNDTGYYDTTIQTQFYNASQTDSGVIQCDGDKTVTTDYASTITIGIANTNYTLDGGTCTTFSNADSNQSTNVGAIYLSSSPYSFLNFYGSSIYLLPLATSFTVNSVTYYSVALFEGWAGAGTFQNSPNGQIIGGIYTTIENSYPAIVDFANGYCYVNSNQTYTYQNNLTKVPPFTFTS
jgi:hypothetical protein